MPEKELPEEELPITPSESEHMPDILFGIAVSFPKKNNIEQPSLPDAEPSESVPPES